MRSLAVPLLGLMMLAGPTPGRAEEPVPAVLFGESVERDSGILVGARTVFEPGEAYAFCANFNDQIGLLTMTERVVFSPSGSVYTTIEQQVGPEWRGYCGWDRVAPVEPSSYEVRLYRGAELLAAGRFAVADPLPSPLLRPPDTTPVPFAPSEPAGDGTTLQLRLEAGNVNLALYTVSAPVHAAALVGLARDGYLGQAQFDVAIPSVLVGLGAAPDIPAPVWTLPVEVTAGSIARGSVLIDRVNDPEGARPLVVLREGYLDLLAADPSAYVLVGQVTVGLPILDAISADGDLATGVLPDPVPVLGAKVVRAHPPVVPVAVTPDPGARDLAARIPSEIAGQEVRKSTGTGSEFGIDIASAVAMGVTDTGESITIFLVPGSSGTAALVAAGGRGRLDPARTREFGFDIYQVEISPVMPAWIFDRDGATWIVSGSEMFLAAVVAALG